MDSIFTVAPALADWTLTGVMGLCIAATCGLRAFLPLLMVSILALSGRVELNESFSFLGSWPALAMFATASAAEVGGDKVPGFDHFMDVCGVALKPAAATVAAGAFFADVEPLTALALGLVGGGLSASAIGLAKAKARLWSSGLTAGLGNSVISLGEDAVVIGGLSITVLAPMLALGIVAFCLTTAVVLVVARRQRRRGQALLRTIPVRAERL